MRPFPRLALIASLVLAAVPASASAQSAPATPSPKRGRAVVTAVDRQSRYASFIAGRRHDVEVAYGRRTSSGTVRLAARYAVSGRCPRRPAAADRRRLGLATSSSGRIATATGTGTFPAGNRRLCVWAREGSRGWRAAPAPRQRFARRLFAAAAASKVSPTGLISNAISVLSTSPITGTTSRTTLRCEVETEAIVSRREGGVYPLTFSVGTGSTCNALSATATSAHGSATLGVGPTAPGSAPAVVAHVGACNATILATLNVPADAAPAFVRAAGCGVGRILRRRNESRRDGEPSTGAFRLYYHGKLADLAPLGTPMDVHVDTP